MVEGFPGVWSAVWQRKYRGWMYSSRGTTGLHLFISEPTVKLTMFKDVFSGPETIDALSSQGWQLGYVSDVRLLLSSLNATIVFQIFKLKINSSCVCVNVCMYVCNLCVRMYLNLNNQRKRGQFETEWWGSMEELEGGKWREKWCNYSLIKITIKIYFRKKLTQLKTV